VGNKKNTTKYLQVRKKIDFRIKAHKSKITTWSNFWIENKNVHWISY